jgi:hypothetical protein
LIKKTIVFDTKTCENCRLRNAGICGKDSPVPVAGELLFFAGFGMMNAKG